MRDKGAVLEILLFVFSIVSLFWFGHIHKKVIPLSQLPLPLSRTLTYSGSLDLRTDSTRVLGTTVEVDPLDVIAESNRRREIAGLPPLKVDNTLMKTAQLRADVIVRHSNFSHQDPYEGMEVATILPKYGYYYNSAGENIGLGGVSGESFVKGFFNSTSHKAAILNPKFVDIGVGIARGTFGGWNTLVAVMHFGAPTSKRAWFGYNSSDITYYEILLSSIRKKLASTNQWFEDSDRKSMYYRKWKEILERQEIIIDVLITRMRKGEPFTQPERDLIGEYNNNWKKTPG